MDKILVKTKSNLKILIFSHMFHTTFFFIPTFVFKFPRFWTKMYSKTERIQCRFFLLHSKEERARCKKLKYLFSILYDHSTSQPAVASKAFPMAVSLYELYYHAVHCVKSWWAEWNTSLQGKLFSWVRVCVHTT